jgi:hypothetical protein
MSNKFHTLDESALFEYFGTDAIGRSVEDGYYCYTITDARGVRLRFSFNIYERSVQTALSLSGDDLSTVSHENAESMFFIDKELRCEFSASDSKTTLTVAISPHILIVWSSLRTG